MMPNWGISIFREVLTTPKNKAMKKAVTRKKTTKRTKKQKK